LFAGHSRVGEGEDKAGEGEDKAGEGEDKAGEGIDGLLNYVIVRLDRIIQRIGLDFGSSPE